MPRAGALTNSPAEPRSRALPLYQIERGSTSKPQAGTLRRISRALGVPLETLLTTTSAPGESSDAIHKNTPVRIPTSSVLSGRVSSSDRAEELIEKFRLLLSSPLAEGVARIIEESFRLLPIIPPPSPVESSRFASPTKIEPIRQPRGRSSNPG